MAVWTHIAHDALSLPATTVTWSSISGSYDHLCIKASVRSDRDALIDDIRPTLNGDTGSNYSYTEMAASTNPPTMFHYDGLGHMGYWPVNAGRTLADTFSIVECWIPDYANTSNFKQMFAQTCVENNSATAADWKVWIFGGLWQSTSAITSIEFVNSGDDWVAHSVFDLYGITGA